MHDEDMGTHEHVWTTDISLSVNALDFTKRALLGLNSFISSFDREIEEMNDGWGGTTPQNLALGAENFYIGAGLKSCKLRSHGVEHQKESEWVA